jgi:hypothetical protein
MVFLIVNEVSKRVNRQAGNLPFGWVVPVVSALLGLLFVGLLRGFTVDDAWIPVRYAYHVTHNAGYRFNSQGIASDGVTPLPWVPLLLLFSFGQKPQTIWWAARGLGVGTWLLTCAALGWHLVRTRKPGECDWRILVQIGVLALSLSSAPLAAWSVAGLSFGVVTPMVIGASLLWVQVGTESGGRSTLFAVGLAGVAASFRPELIVFSLVLGSAYLVTIGIRSRTAWLAASLAMGPWLLVAALRLWLFGKAVPLAVFAKPSDLSHGFLYVGAGWVFGGIPVLAMAPRLLWRMPELRSSWWLLVACLAHSCAIVYAGGDWMPLSRLLVPMYGAMVVVALEVARFSKLRWLLVRSVIAIAGIVFVWIHFGPAARRVVPIRASLITQLTPLLHPNDVVATLDIGWVGAAGDHEILDLAGVTEPQTAFLPGGHTSKRVPATLLARRNVNVLIFQKNMRSSSSRKDGGPYARWVEEWLSAQPWVRESFVVERELQAGPLTYVILRKGVKLLGSLFMGFTTVNYTSWITFVG